jgi:hypothetical protein
VVASQGDESVARPGEAPERDAIGGIQGWLEGEVAVRIEEAEEGRVSAVVEAESAEKAGVRDEAAPVLADGGGAWDGGRIGGKAEEDLGEQVVVFQWRRHRRQGGAAAEDAHVVLLTALVWDQCEM